MEQVHRHLNILHKQRHQHRPHSSALPLLAPEALFQRLLRRAAS